MRRRCRGFQAIRRTMQFAAPVISTPQPLVLDDYRRHALLHPERWIPQIALHLPPPRMPPLRLVALPALALLLSGAASSSGFAARAAPQARLPQLAPSQAAVVAGPPLATASATAVPAAPLAAAGRGPPRRYGRRGRCRRRRSAAAAGPATAAPGLRPGTAAPAPA